MDSPSSTSPELRFSGARKRTVSRAPAGRQLGGRAGHAACDSWRAAAGRHSAARLAGLPGDGAQMRAGLAHTSEAVKHSPPQSTAAPAACPGRHQPGREGVGKTPDVDAAPQSCPLDPLAVPRTCAQQQHAAAARCVRHFGGGAGLCPQAAVGLLPTKLGGQHEAAAAHINDGVALEPGVGVGRLGGVCVCVCGGWGVGGVGGGRGQDGPGGGHSQSVLIPAGKANVLWERPGVPPPCVHWQDRGTALRNAHRLLPSRLRAPV